MRIAIIGSGISGLSAAWLLSQNHEVDIYEKDDRLGGHANSQQVDVKDGAVTVDTGFIVYNERTYPNLTALFSHLDVDTAETDMSFAISLDDGRQEYNGTNLAGLFAKRSNILQPSFYHMLWDVRRFYAQAVKDAANPDTDALTLGQYLHQNSYGDPFINEHLLPMGAAIWSVPADKMLAFPFASFMRFCGNHGLVQFRNRPQWRTVIGGSVNYVEKLASSISGSIYLNQTISEIVRRPGSVTLHTRNGNQKNYDQIVLACHSDQALRLLDCGEGHATDQERQLLSSIPYQRNLAILHRDSALMPKRKDAWASWNYLRKTGKANEGQTDKLSVTYWMNRLQPLPTKEDLFVTLNPEQTPAEGTVLRSCHYAHPVFSQQAMEAQKDLWSLQGERRTWFCGAYFGYGFHEDGLQAGLAVAEQLGGGRRPWTVENESGRIHLPDQSLAREAAE